MRRLQRPSAIFWVFVLVWLTHATPLITSAAEARDWVTLRSWMGGLNRATLVPPTLETKLARWKMGDDASWASSQLDDSVWSVAEGRRIPSHAGIFWLRIPFRDLGHALPSAIYIEGTLAYEVYWDGILLGRSGKPGSSWAEEVPGETANLYDVPESLRAPGEHLLAMRISNYRNQFPSATMPFYPVMVDRAEHELRERRSNILPLMAIGAMLLTMVISLVMWIVAARRPVLLWFAAVCLCAAVAQATMVARYAYGMTYDWLYFSVLGSRYAVDALGLSLLALVILQCRLTRWWWLVVPAALSIDAGQGWPAAGSNHVFTVLLCGATAAAGWALRQRRRGANFIFGGLFVTAAMWLRDPMHFMTTHFLQDIFSTILGLTCAVALDVRDERHKARETQLMAARLEIELLKKNLQPHFMLNTLTALSEVMERNPPAAVKLIADLAEEFRALAHMSSEKQVPLAQELELCRAHLRVITVRTGASCHLETSGVDETAPVPPALFLTLIENGLVHQDTAGRAVTFSLEMTRLAGSVRYTFLSPGIVRARDDRATGGTGLRYIRARLEESFPGRWKMVSGAVANGWQTVIELAAPTKAEVPS